LVLPIIAYTLSSTKFEIRAKLFQPGNKGGGGVGGKAGSRGKGGQMTQTLYAHMNKRNFKKLNESYYVPLERLKTDLLYL
jgi:hypothetical protein